MPDVTRNARTSVTALALALSIGLTGQSPAAAQVDSTSAGHTPPAHGRAGSSDGIRQIAPTVARYRFDQPGTRLGPAAVGQSAARLLAVSDAVPVRGYGALGVTWTGSRPAGLSIDVRTRDTGRWTRWRPVEIAVDGPDGAEAAAGRDGTEPVLVGQVDRAQVRLSSRDGSSPTGVRLDVIDPGASTRTAPATALVTAPVTAPATALRGTDSSVTAVEQPAIRSRAQWGADESMRSGSPSYGQVSGGVIHHTVNANDYSRADVPAILRSIYAYHTVSRGWSDIGYNFLVDRFGRIWEGRYGGITRPVIGAHTLDFNGTTFGASAIGNFETAQPSVAMIDAYAELFAWKLGLSGVAADERVSLYGESWPAIVGHGDLGATACPGRNLYARLGTIRADAAALQDEGTVPDVDRTALDHDLFGDGRPDAVLGVGDDLTVLLGEAAPGFRRSRWTEAGHGSDELSGGIDVTGDGVADLLVRGDDGTMAVRPGNGLGGLAPAVWTTPRYADARTVDTIDDVTGDGVGDLLVRRADGSVRLGNGRGDGSFARLRSWQDAWSSYRQIEPAGDLTGAPAGPDDVLLIDADGFGWVAAGVAGPEGRTDYARPVRVAAGWRADRVVAGGDVTGDGVADVVVTDARTQLTWVRPGQSDGMLAPRMGGWPGWHTERSATLLTDVDGDDVSDAVRLGGAGSVRVHAGRGTAWASRGPGVADSWGRARSAQVVGDWNGDGTGDVIAVRGRRLWLHAATGDGLGGRTGGWPGWRERDLVTAVGDWTGDARPDLVARPDSGGLWLYPGRGGGGVGAPQPVAGATSADLLADAGLWNADQEPDLIVRTADGRLWLRPGQADGTVGARQELAADMSGYDRLTGVGDWTGDGRPDLLGHDSSSGRLHLIAGSPTALAPPLVLPLTATSLDNLG
jgi:hypothetical protein